MSDNNNNTGEYDKGHHPNSIPNRFQPGHSMSTGRPKGSKNKSTLRQELADKGGLTPAELLYSVMNDESANMGQRMKAANDLMAYTETKLSSVELTGQIDTETQFIFNMFSKDSGDAASLEEDEDGLQPSTDALQASVDALQASDTEGSEDLSVK